MLEKQNEPKWSPLQLLLVDDDDSLRETNSLVLQSAGYRVTPAASGRKALELLRYASFDVVITDLHMPEIDGLAVLTKAKKIDGNAKVIIMTGDHNPEFAFDAIKRGADGYLLKPCLLNDLRQCISNCLGGRDYRNNVLLQRGA